eukprot:CAMPEP_0170126836 /NCGR_PEP_ID=MMETSP0020_2-20130122/20027_1 /TAXON_ID=98059 /ORGANISM="Dinobryon sp., Strain UTEXLB2267" /LENGTH=80 /DNA_ID=CAMNT_0010360071 /DNA_START=9 /DNA_END=251 /DNA_ORIENTATION=-
MAASQIMMGMGCHSCDRKMYHFGTTFSGNSFRPNSLRNDKASFSLKPWEYGNASYFPLSPSSEGSAFSVDTSLLISLYFE